MITYVERDYHVTYHLYDHERIYDEIRINVFFESCRVIDQRVSIDRCEQCITTTRIVHAYLFIFVYLLS